MPPVTVQRAFEIALQHHQAGQLAEAEATCRQILSVQPQHFLALYLLGVTAHQTGRQDLAADAIRRSIEINPHHSRGHAHLGEVYLAGGRFDDAAACYHRALALDPDLAEAHNSLGVVFTAQGRLDEAAACLQHALQFPQIEALALNNLGNVHQLRHQLVEAAACYRRALELQPDCAQAHNNLGAILWKQGHAAEGIAACRRAIALQPAYPAAWNNLGSALKEDGQVDAAFAAFQQAIALDPANREANFNLANSLTNIGRFDEAIAAYQRALATPPWSPAMHSTLILTLQLHPTLDPAVFTDECRRWNQQMHSALTEKPRPHPNSRDPERRLRIGYVSPDFREQVVGLNLRPLFQFHDHEQFEIFCYASVMSPDSLTNEFRHRADQWRDALSLTDEALATLIREDEVDVLVDLSQHTTSNRLPAFARQAAPVQVSFAGYPASTGLDTIPYRITDRWLEAEAEDAGRRCILHPASGLSLLDSFWCYQPTETDIAVNSLPAGENGFMTFGCLNNFSKINEPVLRLWSRVLGSMPDSRLLLLAGLGSHRQRTLDFLQHTGLDPARVDFVAPFPRREYLQLYHRLDIVLDTFPYNGHTTGLDALWMGVPMVTLAGSQGLSRAGLSQLSNLSLRELVAFTEDDYLHIATGLAGDLPRLRNLRASLRTRMESSVLMDAPHFTGQIESAYRAMWRHWCAQ